MKNFVTRLLAVALLLLAGFSQTFAQGIQSTGFVLQISSPSGTLEFAERDCELYGASAWGGSLTGTLCGELVWGYDITPDSLNCDTITNDYTGKVVLIRRGTCEFGRKTLWAQHAGAAAVLIVNHYNTATDDGCTRVNPGAGAVGAQVTIPLAFGSRNVGEALDAAIKSGTTTACFVLPRVYEATAAYHYATPVTQVDTLDHITIHYVNRTPDVEDNVVLKAEITEPSGNVVTLTAPLGSIAPSQDTTVTFASYLPAKEEGEFHVVFTNNKFAEARDTMRRTFVNTKYTFSTANFVNDPGGYGPTNANFITDGFKFQCGGLSLTGDTPGAQATHITFGVSNIDSVYVPGGVSGENDILVLLYDMDPNDVGDISYETTGWEDMTAQIIGTGSYTMTGTETDGVLVSANLFDTNGNDFVELETNHAYFASLLYDGTLAGYGRSVRFMNSLDEFYLNFPTELMYGTGTMYNRLIGWKNMHRLQLQGYDPTGVKNITALDDSKVAVQPNPTSDFVNVKLDLAAANKSVTVRLLDWTGKNVSYEIRKNFQNGQFSFDTQALPSGMYMVWVSTEEGMTVKKVAVCH